MPLGLWLVVDAVLIVFGFFWCRAMFRRWQSDLLVFRKAVDPTDCIAVAARWGVTCVVLCLVIGASIDIVREIGEAL